VGNKEDYLFEVRVYKINYPSRKAHAPHTCGTHGSARRFLAVSETPRFSEGNFDRRCSVSVFSKTKTMGETFFSFRKDSRHTTQYHECTQSALREIIKCLDMKDVDRRDVVQDRGRGDFCEKVMNIQFSGV